MNVSDIVDDDVQSALVELLSALARCGFAEPLLVGAVALRARLPRDARLEASREPDLAVSVESMTAFSALFDSLSAKFEVRREGCSIVHRQSGVPIDLVPFGGVEDPPGSVPRVGRVMGVAGFREAWNNADILPVQTYRIRVPTVPFLLALKLFAWQERGAPKDLADVQRLLLHLPDPAPHDDPWSDSALMDHMVAGRTNAGDLRIWSVLRGLEAAFSPPLLSRLSAIIQGLVDAPFPVREPLRSLFVPLEDDPDDQDEKVLQQLRVMVLALDRP